MKYRIKGLSINATVAYGTIFWGGHNMECLGCHPNWDESGIRTVGKPCATEPGCVVQDLKRSVASLELRIQRLRREAMTLVRQDDWLRKRYDLLVSIPGIAPVRAMQLLAELSTLPSDLTVREWVAHSGLGPAHKISGSSVRKASRINHAGNRHLRRALYIPALVASRCDPHAKAFFESFLARNKARLQALIAVARKLLHAIYGIFRSGLKYEGTKLFPSIKLP